MSFFEFPYTRTYSSDLGWLIRHVKWLTDEVENKTIKYADPIQWDITSQYEKNTVVLDGTVAYLSKEAVPSGVSINNTGYWQPIFDMSPIVVDVQNLRDQMSAHYEPSYTSGHVYNEGDWLFIYDTGKDLLYQTTQAVNINDGLVPGFNIKKVTIENLVHNVIDYFTTMIGDLANLSTSDKTSIVNALNEANARGVAALNNIGDLSDLDTTDQTNLVNSINEICNDWTCYRNVKRYGATGDGVTDDTQAIRNAIADGPGVIYFPPGVYIVSDTISVTTNGITLLGSGFTPLDEPAMLNGDATILMSMFDGHVIEVARTAYHFTMKGFRIHKPDGIATDTQLNSVGVYLKNWVWFYHIEDIYVTNMYHGIATGGTNFALIKHCIARNNFKHGFYFNNKIEDEFAIDATRAMQVDVIDCLSENNNGSGFYYMHGNGDATGSMPIGAFINNKTFANKDYGVMFYGMDAIRGITAVRCDELFLGNDGRACLYMQYVTFPSTFTNCQIEQAGTSKCGRKGLEDPLATGAFGVSIGVNNFAPSFVDCMIASSQRSGVYVGASGCMFSGCIFYNNNRAGNAGEGSILCASTNNQFVGNKFHETTNGIAFTVDNNSIVTSNNFFGVQGVPISGHTSYITDANNVLPA